MSNKLTFESVDEALTELNAVSKGRYFLCTCPECQEHEAFMYKNNVTFLQCNRENECGERTFLQYKEKISDREVNYKQIEKEYPDLNKEQIKSLDWANRAFNHIQTHVKSKALDEDYRGISKDVSREFIADMSDEKVVSFMFKKMQPLFDKDYSKNSLMSTRNLVFPIRGENGSVERILLRSSIEENIEPKEVQLIVNPSKEARDFFVDVPDEAETVVISESIIDGMSFKELDKDAGIIALTGSKKTKQLSNYLKENKEDFADKNILIAMDNDRAGEKASQAIIDTIEKEKIGKEWDIFPYPDNVNDPNQFLTEDRWGFVESYLSTFANSHVQEVDKGVNRNVKVLVER